MGAGHPARPVARRVLAWGYVSQHPSPAQLRAAGHPGRGAVRRAAVRPQGERLDETGAGQRRGVRPGRRRGRRRRPSGCSTRWSRTRRRRTARSRRPRPAPGPRSATPAETGPVGTRGPGRSDGEPGRLAARRPGTGHQHAQAGDAALELLELADLDHDRRRSPGRSASSPVRGADAAISTVAAERDHVRAGLLRATGTRAGPAGRRAAAAAQHGAVRQRGDRGLQVQHRVQRHGTTPAERLQQPAQLAGCPRRPSGRRGRRRRCGRPGARRRRPACRAPRSGPPAGRAPRTRPRSRPTSPRRSSAPGRVSTARSSQHHHRVLDEDARPGSRRPGHHDGLPAPRLQRRRRSPRAAASARPTSTGVRLDVGDDAVRQPRTGRPDQCHAAGRHLVRHGSSWFATGPARRWTHPAARHPAAPPAGRVTTGPHPPGRTGNSQRASGGVTAAPTTVAP